MLLSAVRVGVVDIVTIQIETGIVVVFVLVICWAVRHLVAEERLQKSRRCEQRAKFVKVIRW